MKKIISIMLIMMLTSMCMFGGFAPVSADETGTPPAGAFVLTSGTKNEISAYDYATNIGVSSKQASSKYGNYISFQKTTSLTFTIWAEEAGNYDLALVHGTNGSGNASYTITLNGGTAQTVSVVKSGGYYTWKEDVVCGVALTAGVNTIKVGNPSSGGVAQHFKDIVLSPYVNIALESVTTNLSEDVLASLSGIARGTDSFEIAFNQKHNKATAEAAGAVTLKDETGAEYPVSVSSNGETITVLLKKTLDYSKNYTLVLSGIGDASGISSIESKEIPVKTSASDIGGETAEIVITEKSFDGANIEFTTKTLSSAGIAMEGRGVTVTVKKPDGTAVAEPIYKGTSGVDGITVIKTALPSDLASTVSGVYTVIVACEYAIAPVTESMPYITEGEKVVFLGDIEKAKAQDDPATAVKGIYSEKANLLGLDIAKDTAGIANTDRIFAHIAKDTPTTGEEIITKYEKYIALEKMNQATDTDDIKAVLEDEKLCGYLGFSSKKLDLISNEKSFLLQTIFELDEIQDATLFIQTVNKLIDEAYAMEKGITAADIVTADVSCFVGQVATTDIAFATATDKVTSVKLVVSAEDEATLSGLSATAKGDFAAEIKGEGKAREIIFTLAEATDGVTDIGTIELGNTDAAKTYSVKVNGEVTYDVEEEIEAKTFFTEKTITITVSSNGNSGGGSGSSSTSRPAGTTSKPSTSGGTVVVKPPVEKEEPEEEPKEEPEYSFNDLANFDWAKEAISELTKSGIISKSEDNNFNPSRNVTRAEFVKMVIVAFGLEEDAKSELADVAADAWYNVYVAAAEKHGIVSGDAEGNFNGDANITRQDMAVIIKRAFEKKGLTISAVSGDAFADDGNIADYAKEAVYMMKSAKIINGMGENTFAPKDNATRAQAAKVIYETVKAVAGK